MIAMMIKKAKEQVSARVPHVVKAIIRAEMAARNLDTEAAFLEMAVYLCATSKESRELMMESIRHDTGTTAILSALGVDLFNQSSPITPAHETTIGEVNELAKHHHRKARHGR